MKKRIFTAIDISADARARISDYAEKLRVEFPVLRVGWEKKEKLHLTMKFFGDVEENQLQSLIEVVEETARQVRAFDLQIAGTGVFPSIQKPRILWLGVRDEQGSLTRINDILENECEKIGFPREKRNFKPHLTVARLREPGNSSELANVHAANKFTSESFKVSDLIVYESRLHPNGSQYTPIFRANLIN